MFGTVTSGTEIKKVTAVALTAALTIACLTFMPTSAGATTAANPTIIFDGNTLANSTPASEAATRIAADSLSLSTESLSRTVTTSRVGYTFGGWSLTRGGAPTNQITTQVTSDTTRTIFAVWTTALSLNRNGADFGSPFGNVLSTTYRFGETLTLPTVGSMTKSGFAFGGWMRTTVSNTRFTTYSAGSTETGNQTLYAAWIKTVTFNANNATSGTIPVSQVFVAEGTPLRLPLASETTLRRSGYDFAGWSTSSNGLPINNPSSYVPLVSQQTLYAVWKLQTSKATERVFFKPGKSSLGASQKLVLRDLVDTLRGKSAIRISLAATHARSDARSIGKARNTAVLNYLRSLGVVATYSRTNSIGKANLSSSQKNNRVTIEARWTNPTN